MIFQAIILGHHLFENAILGGLDRDQTTRRLDAVGGVGDLAGGLARHQGGQGGVAQAHRLDLFTQAFPIQMQRLVAQRIQILLVGVDRQDALGIGGLAKQRAGAEFTGQLHGGFQQIVLDRLEGAVSQRQTGAVRVAGTVLGQVVGVVDDADPQSTTTHAATLGGGNRVVLIVEQGIEGTHGQIGHLFQIFQLVDGTQVEGGEGAQGDLAVLVVDVVERLGRQRNLEAEVGLAYRRHARIKRAVGVAVIDVLDVDATGTGTLLHHQGEEIDGLEGLLANGRILLVLDVELFKLVLIGEEGIVQARRIGRGEQGDVTALDEALVHQLVDLHAVVHVTDTVLFHAAVVLQHQQAFHFGVPQRVEQGGRTAAHTALGAALHGSLEVFVEGDATGVERFAATDGAAQTADATSVDADTGALGNVTHDGAGGGVDGIQTVVALDQHAGAELTGRGAHAAHDRGRQRDLEGRDRIIEALDVVQTGIFRVLGEEAGRHQDVEELRALVDLAGDAVLYQILAFQLFDRRVGEVHVAPVIHVRVQLFEFGLGVVFQQVFIVLAHVDQTSHVLVEVGRFELAIGLLAQVEDGQTGSHVLVVRGLLGDEVSRCLDDGFVNVGGTDTVIELDVRLELYLGDRHVVETLGGPVQHAVNFIQIDGFFVSVTLRHKQVHWLMTFS